MTIREISRRCNVNEARVRTWEKAGLLPRFGTVAPILYSDRVRLLVAGRKVLSMQRVRDALAIGGC